MKWRAGSGWSKTLNSAVGTSAWRMSSLAKTLLASSWAAARVGPKIAQPFLLKVVDDAPAQRVLGADDGQADLLFLGEADEPVELAGLDRHIDAVAAVPALPGAQ